MKCSMNILDEQFKHRITACHHESHLLEHADNYNAFAITFCSIRHHFKKCLRNMFSNPRHRVKEERWWVSPIYNYENDEISTVTTMEGGMAKQNTFYSCLGRHIIYHQPDCDSEVDDDKDSNYSES